VNALRLIRLIDRAHAAAAKAINATTRQHQYAGFETGRKAAERANHWWSEFEKHMDELRKVCGTPQNDR
jgi:hypothetical protein